MHRVMSAGALLMMVGLLVTGCSRTEAKTTDISIGTAVCGMCADKIEAAAGAVKGVESVAVDLEKAVAYVKYDANKTSVAAIEDAIVLAGYAANDKPADPAAYEKLPGCCKLDAESKGMHESM